MAVKIRLRRMGKRNAPAHRVVVTDGRNPRDGRFIEVVGTYNPRMKQESIDLERVDHWISQGAQPSETVDAIIKRARAGIPFGGTAAKDTATPEEKAPAEADAATPESVEATDAPTAGDEQTTTDQSAADTTDEQTPAETEETDSADDDQDK